MSKFLRKQPTNLVSWAAFVICRYQRALLLSAESFINLRLSQMMFKSAITIDNTKTKYSLFQKRRETFWYIELLLALLWVNQLT